MSKINDRHQTTDLNLGSPDNTKQDKYQKIYKYHIQAAEDRRQHLERYWSRMERHLLLT